MAFRAYNMDFYMEYDYEALLLFPGKLSVTTFLFKL